MIDTLEARNFRCLRYASQDLMPFQVLVGPNASGKSTFLDCIRFLSLLVSKGVVAAVEEFSPGGFRDLLWDGEGTSFELAVELTIPEPLLGETARANRWKRIRYEIQVGTDEEGRAAILQERGVLVPERRRTPQLRLTFPADVAAPKTIFAQVRSGSRRAFGKTNTGNDTFNSEQHPKGGKGWVHSLRLGPQASTLANIPADREKFGISLWLKEMLVDGVQLFVLNSRRIREMSRPGQGNALLPDGSNLPWVVENLEKHHKKRFRSWVEHVRTALPEVEDVTVGEREDIRHKYLMIHYSGLSRPLPSWLVSDGTLRLLALTLPAYLPNLKGVYLIEEPENGIHPIAAETVYQSLSSVYDAQILLCSHSPVLLSVCEPKDVLCFAKAKGTTDIVRGDHHPALREWRGNPNLSVVFASGVLG